MKNLVLKLAIAQLLVWAFMPYPSSYALDFEQLEKKAMDGKLTNGEVMSLQDFCQQHPEDTKAHVILGRNYSRYNFGELASLEFESALKVNENQPDVWVLLINEKYRHTQVDDAQKVLARAERVCPNDPRLLLVKGMLLARMDQPLEAEQCLSRAQAALPNNPEVYKDRGDVLCMLNRPREALWASNKAISLAPRYAAAFIIRARALLMLHEDQEALRQLAIGFRYDPFEHGVAELYMNQAERHGYFDQAFEAALVVMGLDVHHDAILADRKDKVIDLYLDCKARDASEMELLKLVEKVSEELKGTGHQAKYLFCMGDIYDVFGHTQQAIKFYRTGLAVDPLFARAWLRLAEDLEQTRNYDEALRCYRKAMSLDKQDKEIVSRTTRFENRMANRPNDLAWLLQDLIFNTCKRDFHRLD